MDSDSVIGVDWGEDGIVGSVWTRSKYFEDVFFVLSRCHVKGRVLMYFLQKSTVMIVIGKNMVGL